MKAKKGLGKKVLPRKWVDEENMATHAPIKIKTIMCTAQFK